MYRFWKRACNASRLKACHPDRGERRISTRYADLSLISLSSSTTPPLPYPKGMIFPFISSLLLLVLTSQRDHFVRLTKIRYESILVCSLSLRDLASVRSMVALALTSLAP